jgi:hypothetical protein
MGNIDAMFAGMETAEGFGTGQYFDDGNFHIIVRSLKLVTSRNPKTVGQHYFTVECEVTKSSNTSIAVGSKRTYQVKIEGNIYAFADIKNFVFAMLGDNPEKVLPPAKDPAAHKQATAIVKALCDEEYLAKLKASQSKEDQDTIELVESLVDVPLRLEAFKKANTTKPGNFTVHKWAPLEEAAA